MLNPVKTRLRPPSEKRAKPQARRLVGAVDGVVVGAVAVALAPIQRARLASRRGPPMTIENSRL